LVNALDQFMSEDFCLERYIYLLLNIEIFKTKCDKRLSKCY